MSNTLQRDAGYTVLEALVAFIILVAVLVVAFRVFGEGLPRLNSANRSSAELERALSIIARLRATDTLSPGLSNFDGFRIELVAIGDDAVSGTTAYRLALWPDDAATAGPPVLETIVISRTGPK